MRANLTFNPQQTRTLDAPVRTIAVGVGSVIVTNDHDSTIVEAPESYNAGDTASLAVYSPNGARVGVTYSDEPQEAPAERGDTGGNTGSYESRTTEELQALAKERKIKGRSTMSKDALIEALRS
jgi:hypothetical protein